MLRTFVHSFQEKIMSILNNPGSVIKCISIGVFVFSLLLGPGSYPLLFSQALTFLIINFMPVFFQLLPATVKECLPNSISVFFEEANLFLGGHGFSEDSGASNHQSRAQQGPGCQSGLGPS